MHLHIHTPTDTQVEFDSHHKIVQDIRTAVADHKKVQHIIDFFIVGMFLAFLMYITIF